MTNKEKEAIKATMAAIAELYSSDSFHQMPLYLIDELKPLMQRAINLLIIHSKLVVEKELTTELKMILLNIAEKNKP